MDLAVFSNFNVMWTRWSEYTLAACEMSGPDILYLVPAPGAVELQFNCAEQPEQLVADALELGYTSTSPPSGESWKRGQSRRCWTCPACCPTA